MALYPIIVSNLQLKKTRNRLIAWLIVTSGRVSTFQANSMPNNTKESFNPVFRNIEYIIILL